MKLGKKTIIIFAAVLVLLAGFGICCVVYGSFSDKLLSQYAAERWRGSNETPYAQISLFRSEGDAMNYGDIYALRSGVRDAMINASYAPDENEMLTNDAFSSIGSISVSSSRTKNVETTLYAVGGDYFVFHPLKLEQGTYIRERDLNDDLVVIDRELAWTLFGSVDAAGLTLTIGDREYIVAGVVSRDSDRFTKRADDTVSAIYVPYLALYDYNERNITNYETVMPDPVDNFAYDIVKGFSSQGEVLENTGRFRPGAVSKLITSYGSRSVNADGIVVPTWESAARLCEDYLALIVVIAAVLLIMPAVCAVILAVKVYKALRETGRRMTKKIKDRM